VVHPVTRRRVHPSLLVVLIVGTLAGSGVLAQQPYLGEMPSAAQVITDYGGGDPMEARARQVAALSRLYAMLGELAGPRYFSGPFPNDQEKPIADAYAVAAGRLRNEGIATFGGVTGMDSPRGRWMRSIDRLEQSAAFNRELLQRYFSAGFQTQYRAARAQRAAQSAAGRAMIQDGLDDLSGEVDGTWERMTEEEQAGAVAFGAVMVTLLLLAAIRELRGAAVTLGEAPSLRCGFRRARLHRATGVVSDYHARDFTTSTLWEKREAGGGIREFWTSSTIRHEEFDLVDGADRHHVHTSHATHDMVKGGEFDRYIGQQLGAVWATPRWRKQGRYILFRQPEGIVDAQASVATLNLSRLLAPRVWSIWPAMGLAFMIGSSTDILAGPLGGTSSGLRGIALTCMAVPLWLVVYFTILVLRDRRFSARFLPRLREFADAAPAVSAHPGRPR
jgi:hypothetical protein